MPAYTLYYCKIQHGEYIENDETPSKIWNERILERNIQTCYSMGMKQIHTGGKMTFQGKQVVCLFVQPLGLGQWLFEITVRN